MKTHYPRDTRYDRLAQAILCRYYTPAPLEHPESPRSLKDQGQRECLAQLLPLVYNHPPSNSYDRLAKRVIHLALAAEDALAEWPEDSPEALKLAGRLDLLRPLLTQIKDQG